MGWSQNISTSWAFSALPSTTGAFGNTPWGVCSDPPRLICRFLRHIALLVFHHFKHSRGGARKKAEPQQRNFGNLEFLVRFRLSQIPESWRNFGWRAMAVQARTTTQISNGLRQISLGRYLSEFQGKSSTYLSWLRPSVRNFHLLWGVVHLGTPGSAFHLKVVQIYGLCRWIPHWGSEGKWAPYASFMSWIFFCF